MWNNKQQYILSTANKFNVASILFGKFIGKYYEISQRLSLQSD